MAVTAVTVKYGIPTVNLEATAGDDLRFTLHWNVSEDGGPVSDWDLTGVHSAQIRVQEADAEIVSTVGIDSSLAAAGTLSFHLAAADTRALCLSPEARVTRDPDGTVVRRFVGRWDCQWINAEGDVRTICKGDVRCSLDVTR